MPDTPPSYECDPNAPLGLVHVHSPSTGVPVVANDIAGNYLGMAITDATGVATVSVTGCGTITLAIPHVYYISIMAVSPGDDLWPETVANGFGETTTYGPVTLNVDTPYPGANGYLAGPPYVQGAPPFQLTWYPRHLSAQGLATIVVQPYVVVNNQNQLEPSAYALFDNFSVQNAMTTSLHVTAWATSPPAHHFSVHLPHVASAFSPQIASAAHGLVFQRQEGSEVLATADPAFDLRFPEFGDGAYVELSWVHQGAVSSWHRVLPAPLASSVNLDLTNDLLPDFLSTFRDADSSRPTFTWTLAAGGVAPDVVGVHAGFDQLDWRIYAPPTVTSLRVPQLPASLALTSSSPSSKWFGVALYETSYWNDYSEARVHKAPPMPYIPGHASQELYSNPSAQ